MHVLENLVLKNLIIKEVDARFVWLLARNIRFEVLEFRISLYSVADSGLGAILERFPPTRSFISLYHKFPDHTCLLLTTHCRNIAELHIDNCLDLSMKTLRTISNLEHLKAMQLKCISNHCDSALKCIFKACKKLERVSLVCSKLKDDTIFVLVECCSKKFSLEIRNCGISSDAVIHIATHCTRLKALTLDNLQDNVDDALLEIGMKCIRLVDLTKASLNVSDAGLSNFCECGTQLTKLNISGCGLTRKALCGVFNLKLLEELAMYGYCDFTDGDVLQLARSLPCLEIMRFYTEERVSNATLMEFLRNCPNLHSLIIGSVRSTFGIGRRYLVLEDILSMSQGLVHEATVP